MICKRTAVSTDTEFTTRAADGNLYIEGYFAVFGGKYWLWNEAYETIERGAFDGQTTGDVRALANHDTTIVLGRTTSGTLTLRQDERGLWGSILINQADQDAMNLYERVRRGDVSQCSFGFDILDQEMEMLQDGIAVWHIRKVKLYEVSVVTFPAYEETSVQARKAEYESAREKKTNLWREVMRGKLKGECRHGAESNHAEKSD